MSFPRRQPGRAPEAVIELSDSTHILADPEQDIRGRTVVDRDGNEIGKVDEMPVDGGRYMTELYRHDGYAPYGSADGSRRLAPSLAAAG